MKRKDLQVGMAVAYMTSRHEMTVPKLAYVIATEPWAVRKNSWRSNRELTPVHTGNGVAVAVTGWGANEWRPEIVPLSSLKGPYVEAMKDLQDRRRARDESQKAATVRKAELDVRTDRIGVVLRERTDMHGYVHRTGGSAVVPIEMLEKLLGITEEARV